MKKVLSVIVALIIFIITVTPSYIIDNNEDMKITATLDFLGFEKESNYYSAVYLYEMPQGYDLVKINCKINNESTYNVHSMSVFPYNNINIKYASNSIAIEPTFPIKPHSQLDTILYVYISKNISDSNIQSEIKKTNIKFSCIDKKGVKHYPKTIWKD